MAENYPTNLETDEQKVYDFLKLEHLLCDEEQQHFLFHEWYLGVLCALTNQDNPDRFSQAANSLREIMEKLMMHKLDTQNRSEVRNERKIVEKFYKRTHLKSSNLKPDRQNKAISAFMNLRRRLQDITHHNKLTEPLEDSKFSEFIERFEEIILQLNSDIKEELEEIDMLVANRPTDNKILLSLAKRRESNFIYFLGKIDDDETWLSLLNQNSFFNKTPDDRRYLYLVLYLNKIAKKRPKDVVATILKMQRTNNSKALHMVSDIALAISLEESIRLKDWIFNYLKAPFKDRSYINPGIISNLIKKWFQKEINGTNAGIELIKEVVSFELDPRYEEKRQGSKKNLRTADLTNTSNIKISFHDYIYLEDIEPQPKLRDWEYCEVLRKGVYPVCESKPFEISRILIEATSDMLSMRSNQEEREKGIDYSESWCPSLEGATPKCKNLTVKEPMRKLVQTLTLACEQVYKKEPEKIEELDKLLDKEKWRVFKRICSHLDTLNINEQPKPETLKDEEGKDTSVKFYKVITESPTSVEVLSSLTNKELFNYINNYKEKKSIIEGSNVREIGIEGLAKEFERLFEESIINTPRIDFWLENLKEIKEPYIYCIFQKISEEVRKGNLEQLDIWFEFCRKILSELFEINYYGCVIDFIEACLSVNKLPIEKYEALRDILCTESGLRINEGVIPDKEESISTYWHEVHGHYRSRTLAALVKLAHRIRKHNAEANVGITTILEEHLSDNTLYPLRPSERATLAEHYKNIYILDEKWALEHKDKFFPKDDLKLFEKTLSHFLAFNQPYRKTFEIISSELCFAIEHLSKFKNTDDPFSSFTIGRDSMDLIDLIGKHLSCYYVIGAFPLEGDKSLLQKYYQRIKRDYKERWGDLFYFMGDLAQGCNKDYEQKFKDYFDWRFQEITEELRQKELEKFSPYWFKAECLDPEWRLDSYSKILEIVIPESGYFQTIKLKEMLPMHSKKVIECFTKLVRAIKSKPELKDYLHDEEIIASILRAGFSSQDKTVRDKAKQAAYDLLEMDFHWVLDLMKELENH